MNIEVVEFKDVSPTERTYSGRSYGDQPSRRSDQCRVMLVVFALMLASGHTFGWLFFSKYLQTYLFFQMDHY